MPPRSRGVRKDLVMRKTAIGERIRNTNSHTIVINPENGSEEKSFGSRKPNEKSMLSKGEFSPI